MNIDTNPLTINDTNCNQNTIHTNTRIMHNSNDIDISINSNDNHSKPSKPPNKYYNNHYYTNNAHSHSHSHPNPLTHTKSHNQRSHSHRSNKHQHHPPHSHSTSYHQFTNRHQNHDHSDHNNHNHNHTHKTRIRNNYKKEYHNNHKHKAPRTNASQSHDALSDSTILDTTINHTMNHQVIMNGKQTETTKTATLEHDNVSMDLNHLDNNTDNDSDSSDSDEFGPAFPVKAIAFDLDKTMVRTISLHTNEQPQPEQHPNGYFMFFDEDTKEYHHVYKRPHLKTLLDFLSSEIVMKNRCKMMLCTHGTQKYAQTILEKCSADKLFPLMLPRKDWMRRKFEDDYKPRRFKTIEKMAKSVNERIEDIIMIDDDPGVYSKGDRCNGSLLHIKPFDDPYEQRDDDELHKLVKFLQCVLKYGKNYYNKILSKSIRYTGLVRAHMKAQDMAKHSLFRAQLMKRLIYDFNIVMNKQERLGTLFLFDRYCAKHPIDWNLLDKNKSSFAYYVLLLFGCLFIARQYLYTDTKRPKQFRRDPYSAEIWLIHVDLYFKIVKKYKTMNGIQMYNPQQKHHKHHHRHHHQSRHHNKHCNTTQQMQMKAQHTNTISMDDNQLITSYTANNVYSNEEIQPYQAQQMATVSYHSQSHHRRKRKHKNRERQIYFTELHNIQKQICSGIGYPKLLHGLYHRPQDGYDSSLFVKYEDYVESLYRHIEKTQAQTVANNPFLKFD